jgi:8-oxo-dGTP diphosphatase
MLAAVDPRARLLVVAGVVWLADGRVLVQRRAPTARFGANCFELPGGKVEYGEAPTVALARELVEEWGPDAAVLRVGRVLDVLHHVYPAPGPEVVLCVYDVDAGAWGPGETWRGRARPEPGVSVAAFAPAALPVDEFLPADRDFVAWLRGGGHGAAPSKRSIST